MPKTAGIILVGNEILSGKTVDANAAYLCRELRELGVEVRRIAVIPDEVALIAEEVAAFSKAFDLVFTSGGVGPTHDDVTIEGVARALGVPVVRHPELVALLERYYRDKLTDAALRMAEIPEGAELITGNGLRFPNVAMRNVIGEGTLADYLNRLLDAFPLLLVGSYPELSNPEYQVKVTLESRDRGYLEQALAEFLGRLPGDAVVKVT
ncbi:MAG: competence/damage-inducible protein A [Candidatus Rokuibacteriota bacterium]|nr:MAG: competence/damage-inducible protein A [Candidatus Rokubacteria bacterium]